ncbi:MAG: PRD domain-containing protein [Erysipelothrix sp.]|nr:PRD domain-containing protein [Erysipelothrix sp.]
MDERLKILLDNNVISHDVYTFCLKVNEKIVQREQLDQSTATVFMTHLAMATQRIRDNNIVNPLDEFILKQVVSHEKYELAINLIDEILILSPVDYPESEKQYLWLHMCNVLQEKGGKED